MKAFIVTTEYQLVNAINIINMENLHSESDIYLLEKDDRLSSKVNIGYLKESINDVYVKKYKLYNSRVIKLLFVICNLLLNPFIKKRKYECIFISGTEVYSKLLAFHLLKKNGRIYYIEDGIESYMDVLNKEIKRVKDIPFRIFCRRDPLKTCSGLYVYEPGCVKTNSYSTPLIKICRKKEEEKISLSNSFIEKPYWYQKKAIFFGSWFDREEEYEYQDYLIKKIGEIIGYENLCVKMHPNDEKIESRILDIEYIKTKSNFEVSSTYQNMSDKILIAAISSACITPKIISGQEPYVVFLYKLFERKFRLWSDVDDTITLLLDLYANKNRVLIPIDEEELFNGLTLLKKLIAKNEEKKSI